MSDPLTRTIQGGASFLAAHVISRATGLFFFWVASALLGPEAFGLFSLALSVSGLVRRLSDGGLAHALVKVLAGGGDPNAEGVLPAAAVLAGLGSILGSVSLYGIAPHLSEGVFSDPRLTTPIRILSIAILLWVAVDFLRGVFQARELVSKVLQLDVSASIAKLVVASLVLYIVNTPTAGAIAITASVLVPLSVGLTGLHKIRVRFRLRAVHWFNIHQALSLSLPLLVIGFSYTLELHADRIMLGALGNARQVGIYTLLSTFAATALVVHGALVSIFQPIVADTYRSGKLSDATSAYRFVSRWASFSAGALLLVSAAFGPWLLSQVGVGYATSQAHLALVVLASAHFFVCWIGPTGSVLQMCGGERLEFFNTLVFIVLNISLNFWLIPIFGIVGAALATTMSVLARNALQVSQLRYLYEFVPLEHVDFVILFATIATVALLMFSGMGTLLSVFTLVSGLAAFVFYALFTMSETERSFIRKARSNNL